MPFIIIIIIIFFLFLGFFLLWQHTLPIISPKNPKMKIEKESVFLLENDILKTKCYLFFIFLFKKFFWEFSILTTTLPIIISPEFTKIQEKKFEKETVFLCWKMILEICAIYYYYY